MADTLDILTMEEALTAVNITASTDHDDELAQQVTAVSRMIDDYCGPVVQRTVTAEIHSGGDAVWLNERPISSVSLVRSASSGTITTHSAVGFGAATDGYSLDPEMNGVVLRSLGGVPQPWSANEQVEVTYVAGRYASTSTVDGKFKTCAASILRRLWKRESGTWAQSSDFFESATAGGSIGFFRVAKPIIDEMLADELRAPGVG